eukprot:CAMPEP_0170067132 /NCGR_PEP_ID=MMETSP0019_2-20121128/6598_1 /TAXON_ID=98059 /ORGANISM="Dinobryon sp., Strain UTEXLB2267" /LENGTH=778 /DNA_ID=CAMNT_0010274453 /DNA_START=68 /DNA_END=2404 /DNA_ORIENTATION=+
MSLTFGSDDFAGISFANVNIIGSKDEDRSHCNLSNSIESIHDVSSYGVFDGHGGKFAAQTCAQDIHKYTINQYSDMLQSYKTHLANSRSSQDKLQEEQIIDALFCHSLNENTLKAHNKILLDSNLTGTTMCSIFLIPIYHQRYLNKVRLEATNSKCRPFMSSPADQVATDMGVLPKYGDFGHTYRVICGSIGDSRCVMVGCSAEPIELASKDSLDVSNHAFSRTSTLTALSGSGNASSSPPIIIKKRATSMQSFSDAMKLTSSSPPKVISMLPQQTLNSNSEKVIGTVSKLPVHKEEHDHLPVAELIDAPRPMGSLHKISEKFSRYIRAYSRKDGDDLSASAHMEPGIPDDQDGDYLEEDDLIVTTSGSKNKVPKVRISICEMSEDHKATCRRERSRVASGLEVCPQALPVPLSDRNLRDEDFAQLYFHRHFPATSTLKRGTSLDSSSHGSRSAPMLAMNDILEEIRDEIAALRLNQNGTDLKYLYRLVSELDAASDGNETHENVTDTLIQLIVDPNSVIMNHANIDEVFLYRLSMATKMLTEMFKVREVESAVKPEYSNDVVRQQSCFQLRRTRDGQSVGPEAYFGRYNFSLLMTRSIGDKLGPRGCVPLPEITAVTVHATQHARFVIASDGMWDVVDMETVRKEALYYRHREPRDLAVYLAKKALKRRARQNMQRDDITVLVVDVNPRNAIFTGTSRNTKDSYHPAFYVDANNKCSQLKNSLYSTLEPTNIISAKHPSPPSSTKTSHDQESDKVAVDDRIHTMDINEYSKTWCNQS